MRGTVAAAVIAIVLLLTPALADDTAALQQLYRNSMYQSLVKAWSTFINPFGVNIMESETTAYTYFLSLIVLYFAVMEAFGHGDAVQTTGARGTFAVLQPLTSGASLSMLLVANWMLGFIIRFFDHSLLDETFIMNFILPFGIIYFTIFDLISYFRPGFIRMRTRKTIVLLTALYAADLGMLGPVMESIRNIMMAEGFTLFGSVTWATYALGVAFLMFAKFLQKVQASFMLYHRDYIQAQVAEARYQMYEAMGRETFGS